MNKYKIYILPFLTVLIILGISSTFFLIRYRNITQNTDNNVASVIEALRADTATYDFSKVKLRAKAAYVYDISSKKILFQKNGQTQLPLASVGKVALVVTAEKYLPKDALIPITQKAINTEGDSGLIAGSMWYKQPLIDFTLMMSSNDGATALGEAVTNKTGFPVVTLLNSLAKTLNMNQTYFINDTGLDSNNLLSGVYSSAQDVATLFAYAYKTGASAFSSTVYPSKRYFDVKGNSYIAINTNKILRNLPGLVFGKTGFTDLAGGNMAVVIEPDPGNAFVVVVLGSTESERFTDILSLTNVILHTSK